MDHLTIPDYFDFTIQLLIKTLQVSFIKNPATNPEAYITSKVMYGELLFGQHGAWLVKRVFFNEGNHKSAEN